MSNKYPSWRYHPKHAAVVVPNEDADKQLSDKWRDTPYNEAEKAEHDKLDEPAPSIQDVAKDEEPDPVKEAVEDARAARAARRSMAKAATKQRA